MRRVLRSGAWRATMLSGVSAGVVSTLVQVALWLAFTDEFPAVLFRDARLTAALLLGTAVLPPPATFDAPVMLAATVIHFALSQVYAALLLAVTARLGSTLALLTGALFGGALYVLNLYGFTTIFPWFAEARSGIALCAHVAFGLAAVATQRLCGVRNARSRSGGH